MLAPIASSTLGSRLSYGLGTAVYMHEILCEIVDYRA